MAKLYIKNTDGTFAPHSSIAVTNLDIVQGKGDSLTSAMSQKSVTEALKGKQPTLTDTDGGYGQRVAELEKEGIASQEKLTELNESIKFSLDEYLYIVDSQKNVVAKVDKDGIHSIKVKAASFVDENDKPIGESSIEDIYPMYNSVLYITDNIGNVVAKITKEGIETLKVSADNFTTRDGSPIDSRYKDFELFSLGDSLCGSGQWQIQCARNLGCSFSQERNVKGGSMLSVGGTASYGDGFDCMPWRARNLVNAGYIEGVGSNAIIVLENVNDGARVFDQNVQAYNLSDPIEGFLYDNFGEDVLRSIPQNKRVLDAVFRLEKVSPGKNLAITQLPTKEGDICLNVGWAGPGQSNYYIHVVPQETDELTRQFIIERILEYNYTGITDTLASDGISVDFSNGHSDVVKYPTKVYFTDTDNTGMRVSITDTDNARTSSAKYFTGDCQHLLRLSIPEGVQIKEGTVELSFDWAGKESVSSIKINVTASDTIQDVIGKILSASVSGVTFETGPDNSSLYAQKIDSSHGSLRITISSNTTNIEVNVETSALLGKIWEDTQYWKDGLTYSEGWVTTIEMLQRAFPDAHIIVSLFPSVSATAADYLLPSGVYDTKSFYKRFSKAMRTMEENLSLIAETFCVPFINLWRNSGINISNRTQGDKPFYPPAANVHCNKEGQIRWGDLAASLIRQFV